MEYLKDKFSVAQTASDENWERTFGKRYTCEVCGKKFNSKHSHSNSPVCNSCLRDMVCP